MSQNQKTHPDPLPGGPSGHEQSGGFEGGCLCGAVRYKSTNPPQLTGHCHCVDCRKSSGTGHCTHVIVAEDGFTLTGKVTVYDRKADSGNMISRAFCPTCGSALFSRNVGMPGVVFPRASSLDDPEIAQPSMVVYASRAPSWDKQPSDLPSFPEMPPEPPINF